LEDAPSMYLASSINIKNALFFKVYEILSKKDNKRCFDPKMKQFGQSNVSKRIGFICWSS